MKNIALPILICLGCIIQPAKAQSDRAAHKTMDQLTSHAIPFEQLKEQYTHSRDDGKPLTYPLERMMLQSGSEAVFQTTDNDKVKKALQKIFITSPVDFLLAIQGVEGRIAIEVNGVYWVKREDIAGLLKLATVDVVTPQISQGGKYLDFKLPTATVPMYHKVPMGIAAMQMIDSYLFDIYPTGLSSIPSYSSIKAWADSGKPKSEYKFELMFPIMGVGPLHKSASNTWPFHFKRDTTLTLHH
jgi:hypothetical protein